MTKPAENRLVVIIIAIALAAITLAAFARVLGNGFVNYDDPKYVMHNPNVTGGLSLANLIWAFNVGYCSNWHPLTWISHMLDCTLFGMRPAGHHAMNLLLHIVNAVLLFLVLNRMTKSLWRSAFVAALFAIHPLHVESVAWIAERKDVLGGLLWILTMGAYVLYAESPSWKRYSTVVILFALGLMAKPMLVTLPVVLLLLDYWPLNRFASTDKKRRTSPSWRLVREKVPLLALAAGSSVLTYIAQQRGEAVSPLNLLVPGVRAANSLVSYATYVLKMFWPGRLAVFYPHPLKGLPSWEIVGAGLLLVAISLIVFLLRKRAPYLVFGWLWYLITLLPVIGLVQVGAQAWADRYTYLPLIGLFVAVTWGIPDALRSMGVWGYGSMGEAGSPRPPVSPSPRRPHPHTPTLPHSHTLAALAIIAALCAGTCIQTGYWKNSFTLFERALAVTEGNYTAYMNMGAAYADDHQYERAIGYYEETLKLRPDLPTLHYEYANSLMALGRLDDAMREYEEALFIDPELKEARYNLNALIAKQEQARQAQALLGKGGPDDAVAHMNRAAALDATGKANEAVREYKEAIRLKPDFAEAHSNLGVAYKEMGNFDAAIREYRTAIRLKPDFAEAHNNLAIALYFKENYAEAWKEVYECRRLGLEPNPDFLDALSQKMPDK